MPTDLIDPPLEEGGGTKEAMGATTTEGKTRLKPAGFSRRAVAFILDLVLLQLLYGILAFCGIFGIQLSGGTSSTSSGDLVAPFFAAGLLLFIGYFTFFTVQEGQTPAKAILRIKVVNREGALLSHLAALGRSFGYFLSFAFAGLGFLIIPLVPQKRALHDFLTGSYVVLSSD